MFYGKLSYRQWLIGSLGILLSLSLTSCLNSRTPASPVPVTEPKAFVEIAGETIYLEVAQTPQQQATGLMHRTQLADNRGMLFPFHPPRPVGFWMKNVPIPLDIIFLNKGKIVKVAPNLSPCTSNSCPVYSSEVPINQVIEIRGGRTAQLDLEVGDFLLVKPLPSESSSKM